jgi:hypothetical protein
MKGLDDGKLALRACFSDENMNFPQIQVKMGRRPLYLCFEGHVILPNLTRERGILYAMLNVLADCKVAQKHKVSISVSGKDYASRVTANVLSIEKAVRKAQAFEKNYLGWTDFQAKMSLEKILEYEFMLELQFHVQKK